MEDLYTDTPFLYLSRNSSCTAEVITELWVRLLQFDSGPSFTTNQCHD